MHAFLLALFRNWAYLAADFQYYCKEGWHSNRLPHDQSSFHGTYY